jgi:hypothetical protein
VNNVPRFPSRTSVYPEILEKDFSEFAALMRTDPLFPGSYAGWIECVGDELKYRFGPGSVIDPRKVNPEEFGRWCRSRGVDPSFTALWSFALWMSEANNAQRDR